MRALRHPIVVVFLVAGVVLLAVGTAAALVAEVTTTIPLAAARDKDTLRSAVGRAVNEARTEAIAFEPSLIAVTGVRVVGERILIGLLFADKEGEAMLEALENGGPDRHSGDGIPDDHEIAPRDVRT